MAVLETRCAAASCNMKLPIRSLPNLEGSLPIVHGNNQEKVVQALQVLCHSYLDGASSMSPMGHPMGQLPTWQALQGAACCR